MADIVKDLTGMSDKEKAEMWVKYVRNGVNSLLDIYLPAAKDGNIGIRYTPHEIERLETGPVYDETKADAVLVSLLFKFDKPIDLTKDRTSDIDDTIGNQ